MDTSKLVQAGIAAGVLFAIAKFVSNPMVKAGALGAIGVIVAKQIPYVQNALA